MLEVHLTFLPTQETRSKTACVGSHRRISSSDETCVLLGSNWWVFLGCVGKFMDWEDPGPFQPDGTWLQTGQTKKSSKEILGEFWRWEGSTGPCELQYTTILYTQRDISYLY